MQVARPDLQMMKWNVSLPFSYFKGLLMVNHPPVEGTYTLGWGQVNHLADQQLLQKIIVIGIFNWLHHSNLYILGTIEKMQVKCGSQSMVFIVAKDMLEYHIELIFLTMNI